MYRITDIILLLTLLLSAGEGGAAFSRQHLQVLPRMDPGERLAETLLLNPAVVSGIPGPVFAGNAAHLFNIGSLSRHMVVAGIPIPIGKVGIGWTRLGDEEYHEQTISVVYGFPLTESAQVGIGLHRYRLSILGYGAAASTGFDVGSIWRISPALEWELAYVNINQAAIGRSRDPLPQQIYGAFRIAPSGHLLSRLYIIHEIRYAMRYGGGMAYRPVPWISLSVDFITEPLRGSYGLNLHWSKMHVHYVFTTHPVLPATHRFGLVFTL